MSIPIAFCFGHLSARRSVQRRAPPFMSTILLREARSEVSKNLKILRRTRCPGWTLPLVCYLSRALGISAVVNPLQNSTLESPIMRTKKSYFGAAMIVAIMFSASPARAISLYSTLGPSGEFDTANGYFVDGSNFFNQVIASPFSVSTTASLTDALLGLGNYAGNNNPITLYVESDAGGVPGPS